MWFPIFSLVQQRTSAAELLAMEQILPEIRDSRRMTEHFLKGPFNPLEMKVFAKIKSLLGKSIRVEEDSVNSVLLDDQPGDAHERILVAATVSSGNFHIFEYDNLIVVYLFIFFSFRLEPTSKETE